MCLINVKILHKNLPKSKAITAFKVIRKHERAFYGDNVWYYGMYETDWCFHRGVNTTKFPGFHAYKSLDDAKCSSSYIRNTVVIKVKLYGRIRFGLQRFSVEESYSGTKMYIESFVNLARRHRRVYEKAA